MSSTSIIERSVFLKMKPQRQDPLDDEVSTSAGGSDNSGDEQPLPSSVLRSNLKVAAAKPCADATTPKKKEGFIVDLVSRILGICVFFSTLIFGPLFKVPAAAGNPRRSDEKRRSNQSAMPSRAGDVMKSSMRRAVKGGDVKSSGGPQKRLGGQRLKTQLCIHFAKGFCKNGEFCTWAHGEEEIGTPQPSKEMMEMVIKNCKTLDAKPTRPQQQQQMQKTKLCTFFASSSCSRGELCTYAHGEEELGTYQRCIEAPPKQASAVKRVSGKRSEPACTQLSAPPPPGLSSTSPPSVELPEFDQTRYRKELTTVMRDLASGGNVAACIARIRNQNVPLERQAAEFSDILTRAAEENQTGARRLSFAFATGLATREPASAFDHFECEKGLELFFEDGFDDLAAEVPHLRGKIVNELVPALRNSFSEEQITRILPPGFLLPPGL